MSLSSTALQQREAETKALKKLLAFSLVGSLVLHGLAMTVLSLTRLVSDRGMPEEEELIELTADEPLQKDAGNESGGGGGGSPQFSLLNPSPSDVSEPDAVDTTNFIPQMAAQVAPVPEPVPIEPEVQETPTPSATPTPTPAATSTQSETPKPLSQSSPAPSAMAKDPKPKTPRADPGKKTEKTAAIDGKNNNKQGTSFGSGSGTGNGVGVGSGSGIGSGKGIGTGQGNGAGTEKKKEGDRKPTAQPVAIQSPPPKAVEQPERAGKKKPKCVKNCGLDEYLGAEGSARFDFQVDASGKVTNVRLKKSSGNVEVDRKAEEAVRKRKYESSDSGFSSKIRVTSEQEGSSFQRQQSERRREDAALQSEQNHRAAERELIEQERAQRQAEPAPPPMAQPAPVEAPPAPAPTYKPPAPAEAPPAPVPTYEPPAPAYEPPAPAYEPPAPAYEPPAPAYEPPSPAYEPPAPAYEPPTPAEAPPPSGT